MAENFIEEKNIADMLRNISMDEIIEHYGAENILREIGVQDAIDYFEVPTILRCISIEDAISHYGEGDLLDEIGMRESVDHWDTSDVFDRIDGWNYCIENYYDSMTDYVMEGLDITNHFDADDAVTSFGISKVLDEALQMDHKTVMECVYEYVEDNELLAFYLAKCDVAQVEAQEHIKLISLLRLNNRS